MKADYPFPLDTGGKKRTWNLLKKILPQIDITYVGFSPSHDDPDLRLQSICRRAHTVYREPDDRSFGFYLRVFANLASRYPYYINRNRRSLLQRLPAQLHAAKACDLLVCDSLDMAANIDFSLSVPKVLFHQSVETRLWQQRYEAANTLIQKSYYNYETKRMAAFEREVCNRFDTIVAVSDNDKLLLETEFAVRTPIEVIPTGVDCQYFTPDPTIRSIPKRLMFSGSMELLSNTDQLLWFASEIYPLVRKKHPDVTLDIVGSNPTSELIALGKKDSSIRVTGWVPDIRQYLAQSDIYIVPLRVPGGTRVKLFEAMAMKRPVVSTSYGVEGLSLKHGLHVMQADTPREFADTICKLFDDPPAKLALADRGWRLVNEQRDWSVMAGKVIELFHRLHPKSVA